MANYEAQIKPTGMSQRNLVDLIYSTVASIKGICAKLDDDGGVPMTDYEANVFTAIFNGSITDSRGNTVANSVSTAVNRFYSVSPTGITPQALNEFLYQIFDMMETLTEQLDSDVLTDSDYEDLCYEALYLWMVTNQIGDTLGNGNTYWFNPGGTGDQKEIVDLLAQIVNSIETLTEKLDADGTVTDTDYEALWFTATILMIVEDSKGNVYGNALTSFMP